MEACPSSSVLNAQTRKPFKGLESWPRFHEDPPLSHQKLIDVIKVEYPPLYEDRHSPDDYGFIQSTIYTVTACALIFMIAVVLLVSALCKMHMKRAALRGYEHAHRDARGYTARFPPRYEAARLMESSVTASPVRSLHLGSVSISTRHTIHGWFRIVQYLI
nr:uncharacterized protein LOC116769263 [Danaus plexippus plexippus]